MKIIIGSDKAGFDLKNSVVDHLIKASHQVEDIGPSSSDGLVSFVEKADRLCKKLLSGSAEMGILICGTGMGMSLAANKHKGIYAAAVESVYSAKMSRLINNANVLCMGGFIIGPKLAIEIVETFMATEFMAGFEPWRVDFVSKELEKLCIVEEEHFK